MTEENRRKRDICTYGLLTKCEVKMAGYWPSSFFACLWTETKSRSINSQKRTRATSSHLDRANLVNKRFIIWLSGKFCLRDTAGSPERVRWLHLARSGSQSQRPIDNFHKWRPIINSFASIKISLTDLILKLIIQKKFYSETRLVRRI